MEERGCPHPQHFRQIQRRRNVISVRDPPRAAAGTAALRRNSPMRTFSFYARNFWIITTCWEWPLAVALTLNSQHSTLNHLPAPASGVCRRVGLHPIAVWRRRVILPAMNILLIMVVLLLLFGGGGFYFGGPVIGGSGLGLVLLICLVVYLMGGFRTRNP